MENKTITAYQFAKELKRHPQEIIRKIEKGEIRAIKKKVEKVEYQIPVSELKKF